MKKNLRVMTIEDIPEGMRLKDEEGWNQTVFDWQRFLSASPEGCFAAEHEGRVVGTITTIIYENRFAWIGMLLVGSQRRGQGIGTALLERAISYLDSRGIPTMKLDATPQGKPLYEKLGFKSEYAIERWVLKGHHGERAAQKTQTKIEEVLPLDQEIFGADRTGILRSLHEEAPDLTLVTRQEDRITGYTFGRCGSHADHIGPWMARSEDAAGMLLDGFLLRTQRERVFVDCLVGNPWAMVLVKTRGFELSRPLTRMFRGANRYEGRPELLCAVLGPEFG